ncbi:transcriptional regulator, TetR family [Proteiniborus sp. DW1]|uniref:TetR/AcrR family transcriptional regulator n=1 Tax=Proteiniborus sp. DW1 TaxID=1889883 RepID=UPI00092E1E0D|nr:TetR/AcrR family transcriptional regulator [Proteiniborus sp. DW1]SCG82326.1 transcriptional regulator, TetR family [Proteiniborus sp. DW1]
MPKKTFFNLPKEKIDKIIKVSIDEFTEYSYENASINRIVERAEIAKGSFYQYFNDKLDLYSYIVGKAEDRRKAYILESSKGQAFLSFYSSLRNIFLAEMKFFMELPKLATISLDFRESRDMDLKREVLKHTVDTTNMFEDLILKGIDNMDIDDSINSKLYAYLLEALNISVLEYYIYEVNLDYNKTLDYIDNIVAFLKNGVKVKKKAIRNFEDRFY